MKTRKSTFGFVLGLSLILSLVISPFLSPAPTVLAALPAVDDFENGLPSGLDGNNNAIGFNTFQDGNAATNVAISTTTAPPADTLPGAVTQNHALRLDLNVISNAGFTHTFEDSALTTWVSQDWSAYEGISFWLYGNNSGTTLFVDVLDNRNPGSITDDAERWSIDLSDNFTGWQEIQIPFPVKNPGNCNSFNTGGLKPASRCPAEPGCGPLSGCQGQTGPTAVKLTLWNTSEKSRI